MKRKASRAALYQPPSKLTKQSTSSTVSRNLSTLRRSNTSRLPATMAPPKWPSFRVKATNSRGQPDASTTLPLPKWPTLVPTGRAKKASAASSAVLSALEEDVTEVSEEMEVIAPGLRRMSTLQLEDEDKEVDTAGRKSSSLSKASAKSLSKTSSKSLSRAGSKSLSKTGSTSMSRSASKSLSRTSSKSLTKAGSLSSASKASAVATLEKNGSVVTLDTEGNVTTVTPLASGSSVVETTALSSAPPSIRKELSKKSDGAATTKAHLVKKLSSIRVFGTDAPEEDDEERDEDEDMEEEEEEEEGEAGGEVDPPVILAKGSSKSTSLRKSASSLVSRSPSASGSGVPLPPGGLIEIAFSFDTTGSMSSCLDEVRGRLGDMIQRLQADIPGIRISVIAHGDYIDKKNYVIKWIDFGASLPELVDFVKTISRTHGGDFDECYELAMARADTELSWTPGSQRSLVLIGDATPHPPEYYADREEKLDWRLEARTLAEKGVKIYAVQALDNDVARDFYSTIARVTNGRHLKLDKFESIFDIIMAVCYNEKGVEFVQAYEEEVRTRDGGSILNKDLEGMFDAFRSGKTATSLPKPSGAAKKTPVKGKAKTTVSKTGALTKGKGKVTAAKTKGKATAAKTKGKVAAAKTKGKVTAAKTKGKVTAAKTKGKVTAAKTKGKVTAAKTKGKVTAAAAGGKGRSKATASKSKTKTTKANVKAGAKAAALKAKGRGVKVVKGRKPDKSKGKKVTATKSKQRKRPVPGVTKKFREAVKDEELSKGSCVKKIEWTPWYKALVPANPPLRGKQSWDFMPRSRSRPGGPPPRKPGLRNVRFFWDKQYAPAVYEVAVQMKAKKRYVVFFRACASWKKYAFWDTILLNSGAVNHEVKAVLQAGGQIWLRRGNVLDEAALKEAKKHINKYYDYAWHKRKAARATGRAHRRVKKCNTLISGN